MGAYELRCEVVWRWSGRGVGGLDRVGLLGAVGRVASLRYRAQRALMQCPQTSYVPRPGRLLSAAAAAESGQNWSGRGDLSQIQGWLVSWVAGLRLIGTQVVSTPLGGCRSRVWRVCVPRMQALLDLWRMRRYPYSVPPRILSVDRGPWRRRLASFPSGSGFQPDSDTLGWEHLLRVTLARLRGVGNVRLNDAIRYSKRPVSDDQP